jgi:hypothetical protein
MSLVSNNFNPYGYREKRVYQGRLDPNNKQRLFQTCVDYQYSGVTAPLNNKNIVLHCIQAEGLGDVSQTFLFAEKIRAQRPDASITIAIQCESVSEEQVRASFPTDRFPTQFISKWDYYKAQAQMNALRQKTGCMIGVAVPILDPKLLGSPARTIREYGLALHPDTKDDTLSMGFDNLEEGITFPKIENQDLYQIKTEWLRKALNANTIDDQNSYLANRNLYHMYMPSWSTQIISLYSVAGIEKQNSKPIDVFMPVKHSLNDLIAWGALNVELLKENQIGKLVLVKPTGTETIEIGPGKEMRILSGSVAKTEMHAIQKHSQPFFGCTGNLTFSEGVIQDKLLVYDLLTHQAHFDKTWINILKQNHWTQLEKFKNTLKQYFVLETEILQKYVPKKRFYQGDPSYSLSVADSVPRRALNELAKEFPKYSQQMVDLYKNPSILRESHAFNAHIKENYDCEARIMEIVDRGLVLTNYPHLIAVENNLWREFSQGRLSETEVVEAMSQNLRNLNCSF